MRAREELQSVLGPADEQESQGQDKASSRRRRGGKSAGHRVDVSSHDQSQTFVVAGDLYLTIKRHWSGEGDKQSPD